ncbi:hypothetical protein KDX09_27595 [Burkholderia cenocepacia]|uniref:hypothetical protein n=1 Tax=Burkholderia cenocepacia TaxID=95486 RepID=UPI001B9E06C6|nr:hypothetical protein [Burkholderia cenocepacia]MBR8093136.1 hypothetical protein [Burkholderia cenocepacia]
MTALRPDPRGAGIRLTHAENLSPKLAAHIRAGVERYGEDPERWGWSPATLRTSLSHLLPALGRVVRCLPDALRERFVTHGLDAIEHEDAWAHLAGATYRSGGNVACHGYVVAAFHKVIALHRNEPDVKPPCFLQLRAGHTDISELYQVSPEFLLTYKRHILAIDAEGRSRWSGMKRKHDTYSLLSLLIAESRARRWLLAEGFEAFTKYPQLYERTEKLRTWQQAAAMTDLLSHHDPIRWKRKLVDVLGHTIDLTELFGLSEAVFRDVEKFAALVGSKPLRDRKPGTVRDIFTCLQRGLPVVLSALPESARDAVTARGLVAFTEGGCDLLSKAYRLDAITSVQLSPVKEIVDALFPTARRDRRELQAYQLAFGNDYSARPIYCDFDPIRTISVALYDDLVALLAGLAVSLPHEPFGWRTVYHKFTQLKAVLVMFREQVVQEFGVELQEHGMRAFDLPGHRLQKTIFALLQNAARTGSVATKTAHTYRKGVTWFLERYCFRVVDAYPITISRTDRHLRRLNTDDFYSAEQCRELAYHIEAMLGDESATREDSIALLLARILLKTGWNLSPVLGIECDDIIRAATPLNPGAIAVVLRKARAGYRSDAYTFHDPATNMSAMRSAVADLLHIRDNLTADLRASLPDESPYRSFVFLVERKGDVQRLSMAATKSVTHMLFRRGCTLTFDSTKIRKGGVNHLYRQVQKNLRDYEAAAKHDFSTFESSYYRIDENQSRYTLGKAVDTMGNYFSGKEISAEIVIVTDPQVRLQHTPTGGCASTGRDEEAARYGLEHKRLLAERGATARFCADFLSCIWCRFFRLVADPDHVWRLLSYRDYVLKSMEASSLEGDTTEDQQMNIAMLKGRVAEMLDRLNAITPGVTEKGQALLAAMGMHPDWAFAITDATTGSMDKGRSV